MPRRQAAQHQAAQKIDLRQQYPCPCCHQGFLTAIILTESMGCPRCQQIFALHNDGHSLEALAVGPAERNVWIWNGQRWRGHRTDAGPGLAVVGIMALSALIVGVALLIARLGWGLDTVGWAVVLGLCIGLGCLLGLVLLRS